VVAIEQYRLAERRLWDSCGVHPVERLVHLPRLAINVRVQEYGDGPPLLFVHGGPNSGSTWALLAARLPRFRCLILDRPGTGLSDPYPVDSRTIEPFADCLIPDVLDALELERADLVVSSVGGYIALRSAAAHPDRIGRTVQMGCPPFVEGSATPLFMRVMMLPGIRHLMLALPPNDGSVRSIFRQIGHGASLDADRIPQVFLDWYLALQRHTPTFRNEMAAIAGLGSITGFDPALTLDREKLSAVISPAYFLWGEDDSFGGADVARRLVSQMPDARLELLPNAGHLPWLDDPDHAAAVVGAHLAA
jgi:2-hydroxy-6-oxonona-2,4-dienedioate hydrolase